VRYEDLILSDHKGMVLTFNQEEIQESINRRDKTACFVKDKINNIENMDELQNMFIKGNAKHKRQYITYKAANVDEIRVLGRADELRKKLKFASEVQKIEIVQEWKQNRIELRGIIKKKEERIFQ